VPGIGSGEFFVGPALFALSMALLDIVYIFCAFQETLPENKRVIHYYYHSRGCPLVCLDSFSYYSLLPMECQNFMNFCGGSAWSSKGIFISCFYLSAGFHVCCWQQIWSES